MSYDPNINDYVKWRKSIEGWIYFKCNKYVTIEILVHPKTNDSYQHCKLHRNTRVLLLCFQNQWKELEFVRTRSSK